MKIVTWNCHSGFSRKTALVRALAADILVVQECGRDEAYAFEAEGYRSLWFGSNVDKGLAVFSSQDWTIKAMDEPRNTWIAPIQVSGPADFVLLAVWAWHNTKNRYGGYVDQLCSAFRDHPEWFGRGPVVAAGDFNSSAVFNHYLKGDNHTTVVSLLEEKGLTSAYHLIRNQPHGKETSHTHHHLWKKERPFHLDYIFVPREWEPRLKSVEIGAVEEWLPHSDHSPVSLEVADS